MLVVTEKQMTQIEKDSLEYGLTMPRLMENAGSAATAFIRRLFSVEKMNCMVFCGSGNNGGDGFVVARKLQEYGANVLVVLVGTLPSSDQAKQMYSFLQLQNVPVVTLEAERDFVTQYAKKSDLLVDAIFGIGFRRTLSAYELIACNIINEAPATVVSLDIPSGVSCDRGVVSYGSVRADYTVVFQLLKPVHIFPSTLEYCGKVHVVNIGIPEEVYEDIPSHFSSLHEGMIWEFLPPREEESHKGTHGKLLALCGSNHYRGAAVLAVAGALRSGVGICTLASEETVCQTVVQQLPEVVLEPLPPQVEGIEDTIFVTLQQHLRKSQAVLFGCGCGLQRSTLQTLDFLIRNAAIPLVLDGDALTILAENLNLLSAARAPIILTPHPGEMASLSHCTISEVQENRLETALAFAEEYQVYVVLKGHHSLVALPDGRLFFNDTGGPGLAKGGSGDILAGMIGSFLAQGVSPEQAASAGIWLHGKAGDLCAQRKSEYAMLPHDILEDLSALFLEAGR